MPLHLASTPSSAVFRGAQATSCLPQGFKYQARAEQCCGECVQVACIINTSNSSAHLFYVSSGREALGCVLGGATPALYRGQSAQRRWGCRVGSILVHWGPWGAVRARRPLGRTAELWKPVGWGLMDIHSARPSWRGPWGGPLTGRLGLPAAG